MSVPDEMGQMIEKANDFARNCLGRLNTQGLPPVERSCVLEELSLRLQTAYLFPELSSKEQSLLVALGLHKSALARLINSPDRGNTPALATQVERVTCKMEQAHIGLLASARQVLRLERLSALQRSILEAEYFSVRMPEDG